MVRVERTAHRLDDLLKQSPAPHRSLIDWRSVTERDMLWAVATIRRDDGQKADAAHILQCVIQNEIEPIAGTPGGAPDLQQLPLQALPPPRLPGPRPHSRLPFEFLGDDSTHRRVA